jgi:DNA-binding Lrp family transcriptional regulator
VAELQSGPRSPAQLIEASGMSKSWVMAMLPKLVEYGAARQAGPREPYEAVPGMDIREALAEIRRDRRKLGDKAKDLVTS